MHQRISPLPLMLRRAVCAAMLAGMTWQVHAQGALETSPGVPSGPQPVAVQAAPAANAGANAAAGSTAVPATGPASAQRNAAPYSHAENRGIDKDGDGMISREEAAARPELLKRFDKLDTNGDGKLDMMELANAPREPRKKYDKLPGKFGSADTDGDGTLTKDELRVAGAGMKATLRNFDKLDKNQDGKLTREELGLAKKGKRLTGKPDAKSGVKKPAATAG
ncbi:MAG: hypothetical protein MO847_12085 [Candidatus Protistobacter heckmanni]|nr:hypothetical protein [Candidatus Protistobacter heckmanni]